MKQTSDSNYDQTGDLTPFNRPYSAPAIPPPEGAQFVEETDFPVPPRIMKTFTTDLNGPILSHSKDTGELRVNKFEGTHTKIKNRVRIQNWGRERKGGRVIVLSKICMILCIFIGCILHFFSLGQFQNYLLSPEMASNSKEQEASFFQLRMT